MNSALQIEQQKADIKISSITKAFSLVNVEFLTAPSDILSGDLVAISLTETNNYSILETKEGNIINLTPDNIVIGALGQRKALKGFAGAVPCSIKPFQTLSLLNQGGVIGECEPNSDESLAKGLYLGHLAQNGCRLNLLDKALPNLPINNNIKPIILIAGTSMQAGKTTTACQIVKNLSKNGIKAGVIKLTGVACQRDLKAMQDAGACATYSFLDCGYASTVNTPCIDSMTTTLIRHCSKPNIDVIIIELGDGLLGPYQVEKALQNKLLKQYTKSTVLSASDFVGAWGGLKWIKEQGYSNPILTGPATDTSWAREYLNERLETPIFNSQLQDEKLSKYLIDNLALNKKNQ